METLQSFVVDRIVERYDGCTVELRGVNMANIQKDPPCLSGDLEIEYPDRASVPFERGDRVEVSLYVSGNGRSFRLEPRGKSDG